MALEQIVNLVGFAVLVIGLLLLLWSLPRKYVSLWGIGLVVLGLLLELGATFMEDLSAISDPSSDVEESISNAFGPKQ